MPFIPLRKKHRSSIRWGGGRDGGDLVGGSKSRIEMPLGWDVVRVGPKAE
jgi:hypothetical protein